MIEAAEVCSSPTHTLPELDRDLLGGHWLPAKYQADFLTVRLIAFDGDLVETPDKDPDRCADANAVL
jgi:hypothetical protein